MKKATPTARIVNVLLCVIALPLLSFGAASVHSVSDGPWSSGSTWNTGIVPNTTADNISVSNNVTLSSSLGLSNTAQLTITAAGSLKDISGSSGLTLSNFSTATVNGILFLSGSLSIENKTSFTVLSGATVTSGSTSFVNNSKISIGSGASFTTGSLLFDNNTSVSVGTGTLVTINGDFTMNNNGTSVLNGQFKVIGSVTGSNNSAIIGTGSMSSTLSMTFNNHSTAFGSHASCPTGPCFTSSSNPLPIELVSFKGTQLNNSVKLQWTTASETNNNFFTIEKSTDGISVEEESTLKGAGNSSESINYAYTDVNPLPGITYYRLKQTDFDGKFTYSDFIMINYSTSSTGSSVSLYPNPSKDYFFVETTGQEIQTLNIYDMTGNLVQTQLLQPGKTQISTANLTTGIYNACVFGNNSRLNKKLVIAGNKVQ